MVFIGIYKDPHKFGLKAHHRRSSGEVLAKEPGTHIWKPAPNLFLLIGTFSLNPLPLCTY